MEKIDGLVCGGGGQRGIAMLGVLNYYHQKGILDLDHLKAVSGTSIGALNGLLVLCGYTPMEIFKEAYIAKDFIRQGDLSTILNIPKKFGLFDLSPIRMMAEKMVIARIGYIPTLKQLYKETGKFFGVTAANVSKMRLDYINHETKPDMNCIEAVMYTCNLPIIFQKLVCDGDYYIDGGFADNFPISQLLERGYKNVLGISISNSYKASENGEDMSFLDYIYRVLTLPMNINTDLRSRTDRDDQNVNDSTKTRIVRLSFDDLSLLGFFMDSKEKMNMFLRGYEEAEIYETQESLFVEGWDEIEENEIEEKDGWEWDDI